MSVQSLYGWSYENLVTQLEPSGQSLIPSPQATRIPELRFSVVIPTRNQGDTIEETIISILGQNYKNLEIIIIDGGSTDETPNIINKYARHLTYYESQQDGGQSEAINRGFSFATGDILAWINSDDYYLPAAFSTVNRQFLADPSIQVCIGAGDVITKDHKFLRHIPPLPLTRDTMINWVHDEWFMQQCCFWKKSLWDSVGGVDESLHLLMDYDLWFRFAECATSASIKSRLAVMRYYPEAKTVRQRESSLQEMAYVLAKHSAAELVREIVAKLSTENNHLKQRINRIQQTLPIRILKRLQLLPTNL
jgi:glycosyltransferase involved in cell wall biosynthesis